MSKNALILVADVGENMLQPADQSGRTSFELMAETIPWILTRKVFTESKDECGLLLFGTDKTDNPLNEQFPEKYRHIELVRPVQCVDLPFLHSVGDKLKATQRRGDFLDALTVAVECLVDSTEGKKVARRSVVLISNLGGGLRDDRYGDLAQQLVALNIDLTYIGSMPEDALDDDQPTDNAAADAQTPGPSNAPGSARPDGGTQKKSGAQLNGERVVRELARLQDVCVNTLLLSDAAITLSKFEKRQVRPTPWKCSLRLGGQVNIPIQMYIKTQEHKLNQSWKRMAAEEAADDGGQQTVAREVKHERVNPVDDLNGTAMGDADALLDDAGNDEVDKEDVVSGYRFGTTLVPFSKADADATKVKETKCFDILRTTKRANIHPQYYMGAVRFVYTDANDEAACRALSAFSRALFLEDAVAIVRYVYSAATSPRLGALFPCDIKEADTGDYVPRLAFVQLPFEQDIRSFTFADFTDKTEPSDAQLKLMNELVDSMDLMPPTSDPLAADSMAAGFVDKLPVEHVANPRHQYMMSCLMHRASHPDEPIPDSAEARWMRWLQPQPEHELLAAPVLQRFDQTFRLQRVERPDKRTAAQMMHSAQMNGQPADGPSDAKQPAIEQPALKVGSVTPEADFTRIVTTTSGQLADACHQLGAIIQQYLAQSLGDRMFGRIVDCLKAYRSTAVQYSVPDSYNNLLLQLKQDIEDSNRHALWQLILDGRLGVISSAECPTSAIQAEDLAVLHALDTKQPVAPQPAVADDDNLLDELE